MVDIRPFRAIRYGVKAGSLKNLITQPYDKIDQDMQREYYDRSHYNYCRLILPMEQNKYEAVHQRVYEWLSEHILAKDAEPSIFIYRQGFKLDGKDLARTGMIAALRLYNYAEGMIFPHETTYEAPKTDRLNMLRTIQKNLEPVFLIYSDPERLTGSFFEKIALEAPTIDLEDQFGVRHRIWRILSADDVALLQKALESKIMVITDGHHRYESALAYKEERRIQEGWEENSACNFHLSYMVPVQDAGLQVLPSHRLLRKIEFTADALNALGKLFSVSDLQPNISAVESFLESHRSKHAFCIYDGKKAYGLLVNDEKKLAEFAGNRMARQVQLYDVAILRDVVFKILTKAGELKIDEDILYERSAYLAMQKVDFGQAKLAFLVNPLSAEVVWRVAQQHERLPEKSTDFYPKPASGLVMMDVAREEKL